MFPPIKRLINASLAPMERLSEVTCKSCHLVVRSDGKGLVIAGHDSPGQHTLSVRTLITLLHTCSGHPILAFADEQDRAKMIAAQPVTLRKRFADSAICGMVKPSIWKTLRNIFPSPLERSRRSWDFLGIDGGRSRRRAVMRRNPIRRAKASLSEGPRRSSITRRPASEKLKDASISRRVRPNRRFVSTDPDRCAGGAAWPMDPFKALVPGSSPGRPTSKFNKLCAGRPARSRRCKSVAVRE
jgi:hypothetical protein